MNGILTLVRTKLNDPFTGNRACRFWVTRSYTYTRTEKKSCTGNKGQLAARGFGGYHDNYFGLARNEGGREMRYETTYSALKLLRTRSGLKSGAI